ncbi:sensor domain-containing diguanylate cyclase [Marinobacterium marinum]|uniref:diguanylate cyclase n=1 Tax=Marinobacterium marinum TaxID=2756129 RepID=A0A7W1WYQ1_9GAMM|nr:diguanylate cyclase [Marinobacterium marinum]MBA4502675.1 diguanylate cyclase [Marinobacterium marinum]
MQSIRHSIGTRLSLIIGLTFSLYLAVVLAVGYVIYQQYRGFSELASSQFGRALAAAELTRDAEIIAAEVFEIMVGNRRSNSAGNQRAENLTRLYQRARERLEQLGGAGEIGGVLHEELNRWQEPFFSSLDLLGTQLAREETLKAAHLRHFDAFFLLLQQLPAVESESLTPDEQRFVSQALVALVSTASVLNAERPGHIAQLEDNYRQAMKRLATLPLTAPQLLRLRAKLEMVLPEAFHSRPALLKNARATLATARRTRVLAQKLTSATYSYHLQLKATAQKAIADHQRLISRSLLGLLLASLVLATVTLGAVVHIRRSIVQRLNQLSGAMHSHLQGLSVPIPQEGNDEISGMGASFSVFVEARCRAEQQLEEANRHLQQMNAELERLSVTDALTGLANRRCFDQQLVQEWQRAERDGNMLAVIMADVDCFKAYNDTYGHQQGDECLHRVARAMSACLQRSSDVVARYGGEEFVMLLPGLDGRQAERLAWKLLTVVRALGIEHDGAEAGVVTLSLGVASLSPNSSLHPDGLVGLADSALYAAKAAGRNTVQVAD